MKYIVMLGDGMADYPIEELNGKTPLQMAKKPNIDTLARYGQMGMVKTVPDGMKPGSDVANLAAMGYNPVDCYTGRSPLEAVSIGIEMADTDVAFRCNLVTLSDEAEYKDKTMMDYSSGEITTAEAAQLIQAVDKAFRTEEILFYPGISYRHCMIWHNGPVGLNLTPPHDISDSVLMAGNGAARARTDSLFERTGIHGRGGRDGIFGCAQDIQAPYSQRFAAAHRIYDAQPRQYDFV